LHLGWHSTHSMHRSSSCVASGNRHATCADICNRAQVTIDILVLEAWPDDSARNDNIIAFLKQHGLALHAKEVRMVFQSFWLL